MYWDREKERVVKTESVLIALQIRHSIFSKSFNNTKDTQAVNFAPYMDLYVGFA